MLQRVLGAHLLKLLVRPAEKRPTRARQDQAAHLFFVAAALQALENGTVLRVHGHDLRAAARGLRHHQLARADERLLVRQRDALFLRDGRERRLQADAAHHGGHDRVCLRQLCRLKQAFRPLRDAHLRQIPQPLAQHARRLAVIQHRQLRAELAHLLLEQVDLPVRGQRRDAEPQLACDLQRLAADGAGRAQKRNYFCHVFLLYSCTVQTIIQIIGAANSTLSNRSSTPPCPGSRRP